MSQNVIKKLRETIASGRTINNFGHLPEVVRALEWVLMDFDAVVSDPVSVPQHKAVHVPELNADIDEGVVELVKLMNRTSNLKTVSSCQGDPGQIEVEGGAYGHVAFQKGDWRELSEFCFGILAPDVGHLWDDVRVEVAAMEPKHADHETWYGWLRFRHEAIPVLVDYFKSNLEEFVFEEDYPGQKDDIRRERLIRKAVNTADSILCDGAEGSVEEINFLTSRVALAFVDKINCGTSSALRAWEMNRRIVSTGYRCECGKPLEVREWVSAGVKVKGLTCVVPGCAGNFAEKYAGKLNA